ncbi:hypothetical protein D3C84_263880 [compost metagenome]
MPGAEHFSRAAQFQVFFGDDETIAGLAHDAKAFPAQLRQRRVVEQHAMAGGTAAADPPAQLVQLGQTQALGVLDDHQAGIGYVDADLDHRGGDQQLQLALLELLHYRGLFRRLHAPVDQPDMQAAKRGGQIGEGGLGGLAGQLLGFLDQGAHPIGLAPFVAGRAHPLDHLRAAAVGDHQGVHRGAPRRQLIEDRGVEVGIGAHRQGPRDRCGGHDQLVRAHPPADTLLP